MVPGLAHAQSDQPTQPPAPSGTDQDLAKQLSNPVASLISVPFQENVDFGIGPEKGVKSTLNIQPVVPIGISNDWNLILRTILPVIAQDEVTDRDAGQFGLGDTLQSFFFSPKHPGKGGIIWGVGPALLYPTATHRAIGSGKWGAGPTFVVLKQSGGSTFGLLANHIFSIAGDKDRPGISSTFVQPFFAHTTAKATTWNISSETSYDWKRDIWLVPVIFQVTQLTKVGQQRVSVGGGLRYYVVKPDGGPNWGARLIVTLLFPKK